MSIDLQVNFRLHSRSATMYLPRHKATQPLLRRQSPNYLNPILSLSPLVLPKSINFPDGPQGHGKELFY